MKHQQSGGMSKFYCDEMKEKKPEELKSVGGGQRRRVGSGALAALLAEAPPVRRTRTMVGHLWVSVWDTSGESGVSGEPPVSPRSSWMGTETERPFYW